MTRRVSNVKKKVKMTPQENCHRQVLELETELAEVRDTAQLLRLRLRVARAAATPIHEDGGSEAGAAAPDDVLPAEVRLPSSQGT